MSLLKKNETGFVANNQMVLFNFFSFRFVLTSLYTVVFGRFFNPKNLHFWPKSEFSAVF